MKHCTCTSHFGGKETDFLKTQDGETKGLKTAACKQLRLAETRQAQVLGPPECISCSQSSDLLLRWAHSRWLLWAPGYTLPRMTPSHQWGNEARRGAVICLKCHVRAGLTAKPLTARGTCRWETRDCGGMFFPN